MAQVNVPPRRRVPATSIRSMTTLAVLVGIALLVAIVIALDGVVQPASGEVPLAGRTVAEASPELAPVAMDTRAGVLADVHGGQLLLVDAAGTVDEPDVALVIPSDAVITRDGKEISRSDLTEGDPVRVAFEPERGNRVVRLDVLQGDVAAEVVEQTLEPAEE